MKEHKQYSNMVLVIALLVFLILGAYTWTPVSQVKKLKTEKQSFSKEESCV
jgi:uncharacterized membrane protein affecting hemolysin expression